MPGHDIICIGASAGGVEALVRLARALDPELPAAIFVVQHVPAAPSLLPEILTSAGALPARHPNDGDPIEPGRIYIAPPDHHMLVEQGHVHIVRGPKENGFRPAIDATFRTAARAYGPRAVGVVLTGMLDDGTAGLLAIKRRGGTALVQEPAEAAYPDMPASALRYVEVDAVVSLNELPHVLLRLAREPVREAREVSMRDNTDLEAGISGMEREALRQADTFGTNAPFSCPDCGGVLAEYYDGDLLRFRCQVGHAYSPESLVACQSETLDTQLWAAYRALDERATLAKRLAHDARRLNDQVGERRFTWLIEQAEGQKERIREALLKDDG
jgi:two-component system chemotaxis response regulator CheB